MADISITQHPVGPATAQDPPEDFVVFFSYSEDTPQPLCGVRYENRDGARYVTASGEIDLVAKEAFTIALEAPQLMVDLTGVTFMDSTGLGCLLKAKARLQDAMKVTALSPSVQRLFEIAGVDGQLNEIG